jgi:glycerophosphoryl diester phosphodiesterase
VNLDEIRAGAQQRAPVLVTLAVGLTSISILSLGPGSLTSHASAQAGGKIVTAAATAPTPATPPKSATVPAHRIALIGLGGSSDWGPPNTLSAIENGIAAGVDGVEVDVTYTADDLPVVLPEATLTRAPDCTGPIATVTFARLSQCGLAGPRGAATLDAVLRRLASGSQRVYLYLTPRTNLAGARAIVALLEKYHLNDPNRLTLLAPERRTLEQFRVAGARDLGFVFRDGSGWNSPYRVLVVLASAASAAQIADAQRSGRFVIVAADSRAALAQVAMLHPNGVMAHEVGGLLR